MTIYHSNTSTDDFATHARDITPAIVAPSIEDETLIDEASF